MSKFWRRLKLTWKEIKLRASDKDLLRLGDYFFIAVILFALVGVTGGFDSAGWLFSLLVDVAQMIVGIYVLYWSGRRLNKVRTHELPVGDRVVREHVLLICVSIIIAASLS